MPAHRQFNERAALSWERTVGLPCVRTERRGVSLRELSQPVTRLDTSVTS